MREHRQELLVQQERLLPALLVPQVRRVRGLLQERLLPARAPVRGLLPGPPQVRLLPLRVWSRSFRPRLGHVLPLLCKLNLRVDSLNPLAQRVMRRQFLQRCVLRHTCLTH